MVFLWRRDSTGSNVAITNGFDFENAAALCDYVECTVHCLKQQKHLGLDLSEAREKKIRMGNK
jgi:hypothetical protein